MLDAESEGLTYAQTVDIINKTNPRWAGFGLLAPTYEASANICNNLNSDIQLLLGGHQAKAAPKSVLEDNRMRNCKALIIGEGETRTLELLKDTDRRTALPGVWWVENGYIAQGKGVGDTTHLLSPDVDALPLLNRDFLPQDPYQDAAGIVHANVVSARGCPYDCSFCGGASSVNPDVRIRARSPDSVSEEIKVLNEKYNATRFRFVDDLFLGNKRMIAQTMEAFSHTGIGEWAEWSGTGRINIFDKLSDEQIDTMRANGLKEIAFGVESGNEAVLGRIDKRITPEMTKRVITRLLNRGINVKGYFIVGHVDETEDEINDTVRLIEDLWNAADSSPGDFRVSVFEFRPYPGTRDWKRLIAKGFTPEQLSNYSDVDLTLNSTKKSMLSRDEFNFSTNLQISSAPISYVRERLVCITDRQYERSHEK